MSTQTHSSSFSKYAPLSLLIGLIGIAIAGWGLYQGLQLNDTRLVMSWLLGYAAWFSMGIGILMLVMLFYVFGAGWPIIIRRQLEHALAAFPYLALLFIPLLIIAWFHHKNPGVLWVWINPHAILPSGETVAQDVLYQSKAAYLNLPFFTARVVFYLLALCTLSYFLRKSSFKMDTDPQEKWYTMGVKVSAGGIPVLGLTLTFAAFDFFMSISYHWFSTMYGVWFFATSMRAGLAATLIICALMAKKAGPIHGMYNPYHRYQIACLCLAFTVFWAYIAFSQYFLIYNANVPEETFWYNMRELLDNGQHSSWWWVGLSLVFGYFLLPFLYLLFYNNKLSDIRVIPLALWVLAFHIVDLYYNIVPNQIPADNALGYTVTQFSIIVYDIAAYVGIGGICIWAFLKSMPKAEPIPIHDRFIKESLHWHHD